MRRLTRTLLVVALATGAWTLPGAMEAQDCDGAYMACAAQVNAGSSDGLHDDTCFTDYVACIGRLLRFF